jgi:hypothetical protein
LQEGDPDWSSNDDSDGEGRHNGGEREEGEEEREELGRKDGVWWDDMMFGSSPVVVGAPSAGGTKGGERGQG